MHKACLVIFPDPVRLAGTELGTFGLTDNWSTTLLIHSSILPNGALGMAGGPKVYCLPKPIGQH